jgi:trehalose 6-phosphate synthase/phosphatase
MAQTVIVSNRLPVSVVRTHGKLEIYPSAGGLATGLASYANRRNNIWIGWPGIVSDELSEKEMKSITSKLLAYNCQPVFLTKKQIDSYYNGYSNSILWPFFHNLDADYSNADAHWKAYVEVNELFSTSVLNLSQPGSTIWVHDYQLMLLPRLLRRDRPSDKIGFFLHIPFPDAQHFIALKQAGALVRGLLGADLVGFHTKDYVQGFLDSCYELTNAAPIKQGVALLERAVRVADFPMGIDYVKFSSAVQTKTVQQEVRRLRRKYFGKKIILTVDRLDPTKGFLERLNAYHEFLRTNPKLHGRVLMLMLAVPSRGEIDAYKQLKRKIEKLVNSINKEYGTRFWKPVEYMYKSVDFEELNALYQVADVAFVAPIKDGMNLVAKEYIASQGRKKGMLILSQNAGAAKELQDALLVDPSKQITLVRALKKAVNMQPKELKKRVTSMQKTLSLNTVHDWAGDFMGALNQPVLTQTTPTLTKLRRDNLVRNFRGATSRLLVFDYDGVLAAFKSKPDEAVPSDIILETLDILSASKRTTVAIVSGRSQRDLERWFGHLPVYLVAEHGALIRKPGRTWRQIIEPSLEWMGVIKPALEKHAALAPGAFVETKAYSLVWHYRNATPYSAQKNIAVLKTALKPFLRHYGLKLFSGNKILEIKDPTITKGKIIKELMNKPYDFMLAIGDDFTDEDMFKALPKRAFTIKVGPGKTRARYRVANTKSVQTLITNL